MRPTALTADGTLWAWGDNLNYQLGTYDVRTSSVPLHVPEVSGIGVSRVSDHLSGALVLVPNPR